MTRRAFFRTLGLCVGIGNLPMATQAFPIGKILGPGTPEYIQTLIKRVFRYHNENFFDFSQHQSSLEKQWLNLSLKNIVSWSYANQMDPAPDCFRLSHKLQNAQVNSRIFYIGPTTMDDQHRSLAKKIVMDYDPGFFWRKISGSFQQLGWNYYDKELFVVSEIEDWKTLPEVLRKRLETLSLPAFHKPVRVFYRLKRNKPTDCSVKLCYKTVPFDLVKNSLYRPHIVSCTQSFDSRGDSTFSYRTRGVPLVEVNKSFWPIAKRMNSEFGLVLDHLTEHNGMATEIHYL